MRELKKIDTNVENNVKFRNLDYDERGRARVADYSLHDTKTEVEENEKERIATFERNFTVVVSTSNILQS